MRIDEYVALKDHTTLRLGGQARYFVLAETDSDIEEAVKLAKSKGIPTVALGGGSNLVVTDTLPEILVLKMANTNIEVLADDTQTTQVRVGAGLDWDQFVAWSVERGLSGVEALSMIPGTCGATPVQNVGAYGQEVSNVIKSVSIYDIERASFRDMSNAECQFSYRDSIFKKKLKGIAIIESVVFELSKSEPKIPDYPGVRAKLEAQESQASILVQIRKVIQQIRSEKLPDPKVVANVGSFFKNPFVTKDQFDALLAKYPNLTIFPAGDKFKVSAGWLVDECGFKGFSTGEVGVYEKNALVLVNKSATSTTKLLDLAHTISQAVFDKFGIKLEIEPEILGYN